jgi:2-hydroxychromene-2-carboxylate isomerase
MRPAEWYFDFVSPFAYFGLLRLRELPQDVELRCRPVLFAGLLEHFGQKGPAEIAPKRLWTHRWCAWWAARHAIAFRLPAAHPFNPLPYLRLAIAAGGGLPVTRRIFETLWTTGADAADPSVLHALVRSLALDPAALTAPAVKEALRANTAQAAALGVFGVPTLAAGGELFWGADGFELALAWLADPAVLDTPEMRRAATLPVGAARRPG